MKNILFVAYGGGHINIVMPIAERLLKFSKVNITILALTAAYDSAVKKLPNHVKKISSYRGLFLENIEEIEQYGKMLLAENHNPNGQISKEDTVFYIGLSMFDLVQKYGYEEALSLYRKKKRQAFLPVNILKKILQFENVDVVVSTNAPRFEQASIIAANELGIPTIQIVDLFGRGYPLPEAKNIVTMNATVSENLKKKGLNNRRYFEYGQPAIESSKNQIVSINKNKVRDKTPLKKNSKTLLYASQTPVTFNKDSSIKGVLDYKKINNTLFKVLNDLYEKHYINILFRLHPNESFINYEFFFQKYPNITYVNPTLNLYESIAISDAIISHDSTIGIEALEAKKTVFTHNYYSDEFYPEKDMMKKPFIYAKDMKDLTLLLSDYLENKLTVKKIDNFMPNNSTYNIVKLILEFAQSNTQ